jgi:hypothetical protein
MSQIGFVRVGRLVCLGGEDSNRIIRLVAGPEIAAMVGEYLPELYQDLHRVAKSCPSIDGVCCSHSVSPPGWSRLVDEWALALGSREAANKRAEEIKTYTDHWFTY